MEQELTIRDEWNAGVYILHLSGDLTRTSGERLLKHRDWQNGLAENSRALLLDFTNVQYINSAGIAALIRLVRLGAGAQELYRSGCYGLSYHYEKLFRMVGLERFLAVYPSEWAAVDEMKES